MNFNKPLLALALGLAFASTASAVTVGYNPRTGDVWVDTHLNEINRYGVDQRDYFVDDLVAQYGAPRYLVNDLLGARHWQPGDVYYACAMAHAARRPCNDVVALYDGNRGQGWGVVAQSMGIKPGSPEFHALKDGLGRAQGRYKAHGNPHANPADNKGNNGKGNNGKGNNGKGNNGKGNGDDGHGNH